MNYLGSCGHLTSFYCLPNCLGSVCMHNGAKTGELPFSLSLNSYGEERENINRELRSFQLVTCAWKSVLLCVISLFRCGDDAVCFWSQERVLPVYVCFLKLHCWLWGLT